MKRIAERDGPDADGEVRVSVAARGPRALPVGDYAYLDEGVSSASPIAGPGSTRSESAPQRRQPRCVSSACRRRGFPGRAPPERPPYSQGLRQLCDAPRKRPSPVEDQIWTTGLLTMRDSHGGDEQGAGNLRSGAWPGPLLSPGRAQPGAAI